MFLAQGRSHIVGSLGDGINHAPSLHTANVGVSVATAVDVAFGNLMKFLLMGTTGNVDDAFSSSSTWSNTD